MIWQNRCLWTGELKALLSPLQQTHRVFYPSLYHFLDFNFGGGFLGMRKSALMGCMSHRAAKETTNYGRMHVPSVTSLPTSKHLHFQNHSICPRTQPGANQIHTTAKKLSLWVHRDFQLKKIQKKGCKARASTTFLIFSIYIASEGHKKAHLSHTQKHVFHINRS